MILPEDHEEDFEERDNFDNSAERRQLQIRELTWLFGADITEQADQLDVADINMTQEITETIAQGVNTLKQRINDPQAQHNFVNSLEPGARILLCLWLLDMDLLDKIQSSSYFQ